MSVNQSRAIDPKKTAHKGDLFHTIDFELSRQLTYEVFRERYKYAKIGTLLINGKSFDLTLSEIDRIEETMRSARETVFKKLNSGML